MDDFEFFTPLDSRLEKEYKSTTTLESQTNLSSLSFNNLTSIKSNESTTEEEGQSFLLNNDALVPTGFNSVLFNPLSEAVFRPSTLKKEFVVSIDLQELVKTLLFAVKGSEKTFSVIGNYVKGLCVLLSHQVKYLLSDFSVYSKRLIGTDVALINKSETLTYYESDDEYDHKIKKKQRKKRKLRDTDSVSTIQDYSEKYQSELVPIERLEMLRVINLGLARNDFFFTNNEISPVLNEYLKEMNVSSNISSDRDWLSFDDLRMLSSPFKLNAYSFTPNYDQDTVAASSEISYSTSYDIDWSLRNDPLNYNNSYYDSYLANEKFYDDNVLALDDYRKEPRKRRKSTSIRLYDVDLVRAEIKYDRKPTKYRPKRRTTQKKRMTVEDIQNMFSGNRSSYVFNNEDNIINKNKTNKENKENTNKNNKEGLFNQKQVNNQGQVDVRQRTLDQMFDNYFNRMVNNSNYNANNMGLTTYVEYNRLVNDMYKINNMEMMRLTDKERMRNEYGDKDNNKENKEKENEYNKNKENNTEVEKEKIQETTFQESSDGYGTLDILNWLRETFRKSDYRSIGFDSLTKGLKAGKASVVFLRVLILANSNFVSITQKKETINVEPAERFWEPVSVRLSLPVGS